MCRTEQRTNSRIVTETEDLQIYNCYLIIREISNTIHHVAVTFESSSKYSSRSVPTTSFFCQQIAPRIKKLKYQHCNIVSGSRKRHRHNLFWILWVYSPTCHYPHRRVGPKPSPCRKRNYVRWFDDVQNLPYAKPIKVHGDTTKINMLLDGITRRERGYIGRTASGRILRANSAIERGKEPRRITF